MARSRHDSTGSTPVEQYRKQIARQDSKKSKEIMKETKHRAEKKENAPAQYKEAVQRSRLPLPSPQMDRSRGVVPHTGTGVVSQASPHVPSGCLSAGKLTVYCGQ